ncbi:Hypothetical_protein [Hexamita inflata]|uniref:Hypothetical_protein n=1 Tax=Hexamita inflata TaxID=28002 RepID=A0AA86QQI0_9EUKA|nr:Hypothetical protein HINF_LOCUS48762 [Hexamita inflata]
MNQNKQFKVIIIGAFGTGTQTLFSQLLNQNDYNWQRAEFGHETVKYKNFSVNCGSPTEETNLISTTTGIKLQLQWYSILVKSNHSKNVFNTLKKFKHTLTQLQCQWGKNSAKKDKQVMTKQPASQR